MTINFFRGLRASYNQELHGTGIYFATDTLEIIHGGKSYSGLLEVGKSVKDIALVDGVMTITYTDSTTTTVEDAIKNISLPDDIQSIISTLYTSDVNDDFNEDFAI